MPRAEMFQEMLGSSFVKAQRQAVLTIGDETFDRFTLVQDLHCSGSYRAARLLTDALKALGVKSTKDAETLELKRLAKRRGVGVTTLYVFLCWQQKAGGNAKEWYGNNPSFPSVQRRARKKGNGKAEK